MEPITILLFVILFMLSAFFSGTELALMGLAQHKIDSLIKEGKMGSKSLKSIKENNDRLLITILIGNNLVNTFTAAFATTIAIGIGTSMGFEQATVIGIATGIVTFLLLLFGEIIPKSIAIKNASTIALIVAPIYKFLMFVLFPLIFVIELLTKIFSRGGHVETVTEDEIESFIDMGKSSGTLECGDHERLKNVLNFGDITAEEIMTPRVKIEGVNINSTIKDAKDYFFAHTHSRIPVYTDTIDKINHVYGIRDIVNYPDDKKLNDIELREVLKIPLNQPIDTLFELFKEKRVHIAIVIDEYGGVAGLVTLEDIMEEIFGDIKDETDNETEEIKEINKDYLIVESGVLIDEVLSKLQLDFEILGIEKKEFSGENLSYLITHINKGFPEKGQVIDLEIANMDNNDYNKLELKIISIENHLIGKIGIKKL